MSTGAVVALIVVLVLLIVAVALLIMQARRRRQLQQRFGPEYERVVADADSRRQAEHELAAREKRHAGLDIRALDPDARDRYSMQWVVVQEQFVDEPSAAVGDAHQLVTALMAERGYPTEGYEQQVADLSVQHANTIDRYRSAHQISERAAAGDASTEDLRQAMVHYRALFEELLEQPLRPNGTVPSGTDETPGLDRRSPS